MFTGAFANLLTADALDEAPDARSDPGFYSGAGNLLQGVGWDMNSGLLTEDEALTASAVWSCLNVICSAIGSLPVDLIEKKTKAVVASHPVSSLLQSPNPDMIPADCWESIALNLLAPGNGFAVVDRDRYFDPVGLYPVRASRVYARRADRGDIMYRVGVGTGQVDIGQGNMIHIKHLSWDGLWGMSPLRTSGRTVGLTLSLEKFAEKFFKNGANIGNVVELPANMSDDALAKFKKLWSENYEGLHNSHKTAAAPGLKVHKMGWSPRDAQAIETRVHQLREICRIYQVPPHKVMDLERATFSNIEDQSRDFAESTLRRWVIKIEQSLEQKLLRESERGKFQVRFDLDAAVRSTIQTRATAYSSLVNSGIVTLNEARAEFQRPPVPGGDALRVPLNTAPLTPADDTADPAPPAKPDKTAPDSGNDPAKPTPVPEE